MKKQDGAGYRTPLDVARRYRLGDINLNSEEIEQLKQEIVCDTQLSLTSEAPVQNKVITAGINTKVTKEAGKGLSTNDYTTTEKTKLGNMPTITQSDVDRWNSSGGGGSAPIGAIMQYAGATAPTDWLICDGSAISREDYASLYAVIGTTYGSGDGTTTFNLPNFKGRVPVGLDTSQTEFDTLGETGGSKYLQAHTHVMKGNPNPDVGTTAPAMLYKYTDETLYNISSQSTGTGNSGNLQPYITINYIIKANNQEGE